MVYFIRSPLVMIFSNHWFRPNLQLTKSK